jgi:adenosylcobinamide kinase/adenosylcobinamide-phosphate guanylyltransferase
MGQILFVLGGARSGKSRYAQTLAAAAGPRVTYLATAEVGDAEMAERVRRHQDDRPASWRTVEEPRQIATALRRWAPESDAVLLDCLTLFVTNVLLAPGNDAATAESEVTAELESLLAAARETPCRTVIVSNEVGLGLVPEYPLGRAFRDIAGRANQQVAAAADAVYFLVAGIPLSVK